MACDDAEKAGSVRRNAIKRAHKHSKVPSLESDQVSWLTRILKQPLSSLLAELMNFRVFSLNFVFAQSGQERKKI